MLARIFTPVAIAASILLSTPAAAVDYVFAFELDPGPGFFSAPGQTIDITDNSFSPFDLEVGDTIAVTVSFLNNSVTLPTSSSTGVLFFDALLSQGLNAPPNEDDVTSEESFTINGEQQFSGCVNCVFSAFSRDPNSPPVVFNSFSSDFRILNLFPNDPSSPVTVSGFRLSYAQFAPPPAIPEPATWGMMILGFGAVGAAMRRSRFPSWKARLA